MANNRTPTDEHKAAMQRGRELAKVVDQYLQALGGPKKKGRHLSPEELAKRAHEARLEAAQSVGVASLKARQLARDLEERRDTLVAQREALAQIGDLEAAFVSVAAEYSKNQGISYQTWRESGVPAATLKAAGIN